MILYIDCYSLTRNDYPLSSNLYYLASPTLFAQVQINYNVLTLLRCLVGHAVVLISLVTVKTLRTATYFLRKSVQALILYILRAMITL